jgi:hypothetical protein
MLVTQGDTQVSKYTFPAADNLRFRVTLYFYRLQNGSPCIDGFYEPENRDPVDFLNSIRRFFVTIKMERECWPVSWARDFFYHIYNYSIILK